MPRLVTNLAVDTGLPAREAGPYVQRIRLAAGGVRRKVEHAGCASRAASIVRRKCTFAGRDSEAPRSSIQARRPVGTRLETRDTAP